MMREFFGVKSTVTRSAVGDDVAIEGGSVVSDSALGAGSVRGSALANVACDEIDAEGAPRTPSSALRAPQPPRPPHPPIPHPLTAQDRFWGRLWVDFGDCAGVCMCDCLIANM